MATIVISTLILAAVAGAVMSLVRQKRSGSGGCSCGCEGCTQACGAGGAKK